MSQKPRSLPATEPLRSARVSELVFLPLGGAGEIGMNCYLYGLGPPDAREWLMVDLGITFPEGTNEPGVDVILPDTRFIEEEVASLKGIVLTHAHEDHFGAVIELWPRLKVPIYATPFTAALLKAKLAEHGNKLSLPIREVPLKGRFQVGPFDVELVSVCHSIPEPNALAIRTPLGLVVHSGDWKVDKVPVAGNATDLARLGEIASEGVTAFICDSTNALREGYSPSEDDVAARLAEVIKAAKNRVAVTTFASNVSRIRAVWQAARAARRQLVVVGRAMHRVIEVARETGYLPEDFRYSDQREFGYLERSEVVALCTGSQGEPRAALSRIAEGQHPDVSLAAGDLVIFSSRTIPGNEPPIARVQNNLASRGVEMITDGEALVHVTGHPRRGELRDMYALLKPAIAVPMHGEMRHLVEHARLARAAGVKDVQVVKNGQVARLAPGPSKIVDEAPAGSICRDGKLLVPNFEGPVRERRKLSAVGLVAVSLVVDKKGEVIADPEVAFDGVPLADMAGRSIVEAVLDAIDGTIESIPRARRKDHEMLAEAVRRSVRATIDEVWGKKPICKVLLTRLG